MVRVLAALLIAAAATTAARAEGERAGVFDYYVLALSWSPNWCAIEGDAKGSDQCHPRHDHGWVLHGLWPQYHRGWPSFCPSAERPPSRTMTGAMADIMGTSGLAWYQWNKHGVCAGIPAAEYYATARAAYDKITRPAVFRNLADPVRLPASVVEQAFLRDNPGLEPDGITITCKAGRIQEARICLSKTLDFVPCGRDVVRDCTATDALFDPVR